MKKFLVISFILVLLSACSVEPEPINYGNDKCDFCTMTIMDKPYGTELVTDKGKVYKFDSTECMLNYAMQNNTTYAMYLTNTMDQPGELIDASTTYYLVSENLPSPMGANITAFSSKASADEAQEEYEGTVYNFDELKSFHSNNETGEAQNHSH